MYKILVLGILLLFALGGYYLVSNSKVKQMPERTVFQLQNRERVQILVKNQNDSGTDTSGDDLQTEASSSHTITVEVVNTPESMAQGLSGRTEIGADGMLFIFPTKEIKYFWMKDMQFPIDIIWIADDTVISVSEHVPIPDPETPDFRLEIYPSTEPVNVVLEIPAGDAKRLSIKPGTVVQLVQ